jgi:L-amino acid N-acyltransferase YncA
VDLDIHTIWLAAALRDKGTEVLIAESHGTPIATCRFEPSESTPNASLVSINLAPHRRGQGMGGQLLISAVAHFFSRHNSDLLADIHKNNAASERIFMKAGFRCVRSDGDFNRFLLKAASGDAS